MKKIYVSPEGNDANPGSIGRPVATLKRALLLYADHRQEDGFILFRAGTYSFDETVIVNKGSEPACGKSLRIASYDGESVVLSGGVKLSGWEPVPGRAGIWQTPLPPLPSGKVRVCALYGPDGLLPRSSSHASLERGFETINERCGAFTTDFCTTKEARTTLHFPEGSLMPWDNLEDIEIYISPQRPWLVNYLGIESVDFDAGTARVTPQATYELFGRFTIENHIDFITEPGEWAIDSTRKMVYFKPSGDEPGDSIILPRLDELIRIEGINSPSGENDDPVRGIHMEGLTLCHCDRAVWKASDKGIQHDWAMWDKSNALIRFCGAEDCSVKHCTLEHTGGDGIRLDRYCQSIAVSHNHIGMTGGVGVLLAGYGPGHKDVNKGNLVLDNEIHHTGTLFPHSMGLFVWQSGGNRFAHNHIHNLGYMGVVLSGVRRRFWNPQHRPRDIRENIPLIDFDATAHLEGGDGDWDMYKEFMHCRDNIVEFNEIHDCMQRLDDGNTIYLSATGPNNIIRSNLAYNHHKNFLMRTDDDQFDSLWEKNILIGHSENGRGFTHKGRNAFNNNLLINCVCGVYMGPHGPSEGIDSIRRNIFTFDGDIDGPLLKDDSGFGKNVVDYNIFYANNLNDACVFLEKRRAQQSDLHSQVTDPGFRDADGLDFSFTEDSPAAQLGIEPIEFEKIGRLNSPSLARLRTSGTLEKGAQESVSALHVG